MSDTAQANSEFKWDELVSASTAGLIKKTGGDLVSLFVCSSLMLRRLYCFTWCTAAGAGEYWLAGSVRLYRNRSLVQEFPVATGLPAVAASALPKSLPSLMVSGNTPVDDAIQLVVGKPYNGEPSIVTMAPLTVQAEIDQVGFAVTDQVNIGEFRIFLGCLSLKA